jgi:hypothetical protein
MDTQFAAEKETSDVAFCTIESNREEVDLFHLKGT